MCTKSKLNNVLDLIISDSTARINELSFGPPLGKALQGHKTISFELNLAASGESTKFSSKQLAWHRGNYDGLRHEFKRTDWVKCLGDLNVEEAYHKFLQVYNDACM